VTDDGTHRARGPFGPLEMLDEVQRQAFEAAMRVTSELTSLSGGLADVAWLRDLGGANGTTGPRTPDDRPPMDVGRLRSDVAKAAETFADLLRAVLDVGFDAVDELAHRPLARPVSAAAPGRPASLTCTVRNGPDAVSGLRAHVPQLASVDGVVLHAPVAVSPERFDLEPHQRIEVTVSVPVPPDAGVGRYHGLLLVSGLPDSAQAVTVQVTPPEAVDDRR
jgi:hypothetical protein